MEGKVKWFNASKGFGFIIGEDNKEYFVHVTQIPKETEINESDLVNFEAVETDRGIQAQNVELQ